MGKQKSSSASSATRKKHARKAQGHKGEDDSTGTTPQSSTSKGNQPKGTGVSGKGKGKKKAEPRVKMYIPPVKPAALQKDPVDKLSLAGVLDPELLVVLRKLAKRDGITKRRALEELVGWIGRCESEAAEEREAALDGLQVALPAWVSSTFRIIHGHRYFNPNILEHALSRVDASSIPSDPLTSHHNSNFDPLHPDPSRTTLDIPIHHHPLFARAVLWGMATQYLRY